LRFTYPHGIHQLATMGVLDSETETYLRAFRFDSTLLELAPEEEAFFKAETGIQDPEELREHIVGVHEEAYKACTLLLACWSSVTRR